MSAIAIITARGGSKRIPGKNIKSFLGKPIIQYSIEAALQSKVFDEVMVSTDDEAIADISKKLGAHVPFFRSKKNSDDHSTTADVIEEVLKDYESKLSKKFEFFCCLYPTAPFITAKKLQSAFSKLKEKQEAHTVVPVVRFSFPIQRALKLAKDGRVEMANPEHMNTRSQDLDPRFHDCGQFYFGRTQPFLKNKKLFSEFTLPLEMSELEVQDIDNETDWKIAEIKYSTALKPNA